MGKLTAERRVLNLNSVQPREQNTAKQKEDSGKIWSILANRDSSKFKDRLREINKGTEFNQRNKGISGLVSQIKEIYSSGEIQSWEKKIEINKALLWLLKYFFDFVMKISPDEDLKESTREIFDTQNAKVTNLKKKLFNLKNDILSLENDVRVLRADKTLIANDFFNEYIRPFQSEKTKS